MIDTLQDFTTSLPPVLRWLALMAAGAVPFVESYLGSAIGIVVGVNAPVAVAAAVVGNVASMVVMVLGAHAVRGRAAGQAEALSIRRQRLRRWFHRYGVAAVSLLGQTILPSQFTSAALVSFGAPKNMVIVWQVISIILWGVVFGILATLGVDLLGPR